VTPSGPAARIVSTLSYPRRSQWNARVEVIDPHAGPRAKAIRRLAGAAGRCDVMVLDGSVGIRAKSPDLAVAALVGLRRNRPPVVMAEANWKAGSGARHVLRSAGMKAIARAITIFCVVSKHELEAFPATWGISPDRVVYTPFYYTLGEDELAVPTSEGGGVFAGGNPMRDYATLIEAVRALDVPVAIATSRPEIVGYPGMPGNVRAGRIPHDDYVRQLRAADVVVVPLQGGTERSGGEQTYLNGMALGKVVIVTDSPGATDYIESGVTGIIVPSSDADAMRAAIAWATDPAQRDAARRMGEAAKAHVLPRFGPDQWVDRLLEVADAAAAGGGPAAAASGASTRRSPSCAPRGCPSWHPG